MYEKELQRILTASQNNALTFFVGAGVSALSGAPTWKGLIHAISDKLGQAQKDEYSSDEYLQIPQMFYYSLGENKEEYYTFVKAQLHSSPMLPNVIHREMLNLNPVSFITTNYDTLAASLSPSVHDVPSGQVQKLAHQNIKCQAEALMLLQLQLSAAARQKADVDSNSFFLLSQHSQGVLLPLL